MNTTRGGDVGLGRWALLFLLGLGTLGVGVGFHFERMDTDAEDSAAGCFESSVVDCLDTKLTKSLQMVLHCLERFGGVALPLFHLAGDAEGFSGAV